MSGEKRCYISGAGEFYDGVLPERGDLVIAADGGYSALVSRKITPDIVVGDFDSLGFVPNHPTILQTPSEKDDTDVMLAVRHGFMQECGVFIINGALGGRLDHTLANIQILTNIAQNGARGFLAGRDITITAFTDGSVRFKPGAFGKISVFCAGDKAEGVYLSGLKYPLENATLTAGYPLGVSNEFSGAPATVTVRSGTLIVTWESGLDVISYSKS